MSRRETLSEDNQWVQESGSIVTFEQMNGTDSQLGSEIISTPKRCEDDFVAKHPPGSGDERPLLHSKLPKIDSNYISAVRFYKLLFVTVIVSISGFISGYFGIFASVSILDPVDDCTHNRHHYRGVFFNEHHLDPYQSTLATVSMSAGSAVGTLILYLFSKILNKYSRVGIITVSSIVVSLSFTVTSLFAFFGRNNYNRKHQNVQFYLLCLCLFVSGIGIGIQLVCSPILISEYCPRYYRAQMVAIYQLFITLGILTCVIFGTEFHKVKRGWLYVWLIGWIIATLQVLLTMVYLPQSPRWLLSKFYNYNYLIKHRQKLKLRAKKNFVQFWKISRLNEINVSEREYEKMKDKIKHNVSNFETDEFWQKNISSLVLVGVCLNIFQQFSGIDLAINQISGLLCAGGKSKSHSNYDYVYNYSYNYNYSDISDTTDIGSNYKYSDDENGNHESQATFGALTLYVSNVIVTLIALKFIQRIEYKRYMFGGISLMLVSIVFFVVFDLMGFYKGKNGYYQLIPLSFYVTGYAMSLGIFMWVIYLELFPIKVRLKYCALCMFCNRLSNCIVKSNLLIHLIDVIKLRDYDICVMFSLFGICLIINLLYVARKIPNANNSQRRAVGTVVAKNAVLLEDAAYSYRRFHPLT